MHTVRLFAGAAAIVAAFALSAYGQTPQAPLARGVPFGRPDIVLADFEGTGYGAWKTTGTAFGMGPARGTLSDQMTVSGFAGHGIANSFHGRDDATGTLTSPTFTIERKYLNFLIGGGGFPGKTCLNLRVDGKIVRTATGPNKVSGGSERLAWHSWDVSGLEGQSAQIEVVDNATGGWGHINVDDITLSDDRKAVEIVSNVLYGETYRPQFHFTAKTGWLNDPNGMVYDGREYHLFFQHNPFGTAWGNMTWGHAVSRDLVQWTQLDNALKPDALGTMYSGSAVVDATNTTGFQSGSEPPLVALYTAAGGTSSESVGKPFSQCMAYSVDRGRTWTKYAGNPVIPHIAAENRDPKVVWYAPTRQWIMALYLDREEYGLFSSPDMKTWTRTQTLTLPGSSECPDFFPIPLDGDKNRLKWVLTGANGHYLVGAFDGATFTSEAGPFPADAGANYYAVQTFSDIPARDGRRIQIAWMNGGVYPEMPFNQQMSFPCELTLHATPYGPRLRRYPVAEIARLHEGETHREKVTLTPPSEPLSINVGQLVDVSLTIDLKDAAAFAIDVRGGAATIRYDAATQTLTCLDRHASIKPVNGRITLRLLLDRTSLELFGNEGELSMTSCFLPDPRREDLTVRAEGSGTLEVVSLRAYRLRSAWPATNRSRP